MEIQEKLELLRKEYVQFPEKRKTIELQARVLKAALKKQKDEEFEKMVVKELRGTTNINGFEVPNQM